MDQAQVVLITLVIYKLVMIAIGIYGGGRTRDETDFFLAGRRMGPWVASLSASASSSSAWTLLGVSGAAYAWGLSALWLFPACLGGFLLNWYFIAPRLRRMSHDTQALTVTDILAGPKGTAGRNHVATLAALIILFSFLFYVASQFQGSGKTFESTFHLGARNSILLGAAIIVFYTMVGGFWAVSLTDALQGLVMVGTAVLLPSVALVAVGGPTGFGQGLAGVDQPGYLSLIGNMALPAGIGFVAGLLGIGLGYPGQPHVVNRFMALRDEAALCTGRAIAIAWAVFVYAGMILLGLCGRVLFPEIADKEMVFLEVANELFHPVITGVMVAGVLSATMSTADSQLLVAASCITHDLPFVKTGHSLFYSRLVVLLLSAGAVVVALFGTAEIFSRVLFAWTAMGAAFGPLLLVNLVWGPVSSPYRWGAMAAGFVLSVVAYSIPEARNSWWDRVLPFLIAFGISYAGYRRLNGHKTRQKSGLM